MISIELSKFRNKELIDILKKNNIKNYSKLNKKDLIKKVKHLINNQNGGSPGFPDIASIPPHMLKAQRPKKNVSPPPPYQPPQHPRPQYISLQHPPPPYLSPQHLQHPRPQHLSLQHPRPQYLSLQNSPPPYLSPQHLSPQHLQHPPPAYQPPQHPPPPYQPPQHPPPNSHHNISRIQQNRNFSSLLQAREIWQNYIQSQESGPKLLETLRQQQPRKSNTMQNRISCPSNGWSQDNNDCWIDSAYYSMFVPSNLKDWFFKFFTDIRSSEIESLKNFSNLSFEYLQGIDGNRQFLSRKQKLKKDILTNIRAACGLINRDLYNALSARSAIRELYNTTGTMNRGGNGDASLFFKFISIIQPKLLFFEQPSWVDILSKSNGNKVIQKYIRDKLRTQNSNPNIDIVAIDASYYTPGSQADIRPEILYCMNDITVLEEILSIGNFSLEAVIRGNRVHYTLDFKCQDNDWYEYNNMKNPRHITRIDDVSSRNWQGIDGLIFIFRRRS